MIDFHTHTFFSDGVLSLAEHIRRAYIAGYKVIGITDHCDFSNFEHIYYNIYKFVETMKDCNWDIKIIPGIEITHVPVKLIEKLVTKARDIKVPLIIVHGETIVEPVEKGTNRAAIESLVDIVAHPGLILEEDVKRASELNVSLEITAKKGHSLTNGYVAKIAKKYNCNLVLDSDAHAHDEFLKPELREKILTGCGMEQEQIQNLEYNIIKLSEKLINKIV